MFIDRAQQTWFRCLAGVSLVILACTLGACGKSNRPGAITLPHTIAKVGPFDFELGDELPDIPPTLHVVARCKEGQVQPKTEINANFVSETELSPGHGAFVEGTSCADDRQPTAILAGILVEKLQPDEPVQIQLEVVEPQNTSSKTLCFARDREGTWYEMPDPLAPPCARAEPRS
jgi:hypothetical protein